MKKLFWLLALFFMLLVNSQVPKDTAQIITSTFNNSEMTEQKPYVILISSDGFRYDYMEKFQTKNLLKLAKNGVWATNGMYPSYPSITFPNHYSLVTGLYPAHHGLVDNIFYDPQRNETYKIGSKTVTDGSWYKGTPLWTLAENQGMKAASLFWVGSESNAGGKRPSYYYPYHEKFSGSDKVKIIKNWLTLPKEQRPHLITLYFPEVDHAGHRYGPDAQQTKDAALLVDKAIQELTNELADLHLPINYIFVSDHGMIKIDEKDYIKMPKIDKEKFVVVNSTSFARITAKNTSDIIGLYQELKQQPHSDYKIYLTKKIPKRLHYSSREDSTRRIGDIILVPKRSKGLIDEGRKISLGKHGFDSHRIPEMKAIFFAWGPAFKENKKVSSFENIHIYPLVASILGLEISEPIDGKTKKIKRFLK
ncbi:MAG: alkaline phosphatase family protein [Bacteroidetes bacterium]|nr:alkaline phosphatase family protein [Bacteroidota bacterium]